MLADVIDASGADALARALSVGTPRRGEVPSVATVAVKRCQVQSNATRNERPHRSTAPKQIQRRRAFTLIDHAFEAEVAWSLWRLSTSYGFDDMRSRRRAIRHAAIAGWIFATCAPGGVSGAFQRSSELARAFERGRAIYFAAMKLQSTNEEEASA
jgi:hypothetical protein